MNAWNAIAGFYKAHGTKLLAFLQGMIATVAGVSNLIPEHQLKYWLGASAVIVFYRGWENTNAKT